MANMNPNPSAKAGESYETLYQRAAKGLAQLFGGSKEPGIFQQNPLPADFTSRAQFVRALMDSEGSREFLNSLPQPYTNSLAVVMAARGNPKFPPELVMEFVPRPPRRSEDEDEVDDATRLRRETERLGLLAEIAKLTTDSATGKIRVAMKLPFGGHLDYTGSVVSIFEALTADEKEKLGLDKVEPGSGFREFSSDLEGVVAELGPRTLTPMQRFYLRAQQWSEQREADRIEREKRRRGQYGRGEDAAAALPHLPPQSAAEALNTWMMDREAAIKPEPEAPKGPVIPDLSALTGGRPPQPPATSPRAPREKRAAVLPTAVTALVPPAEEPKPAAIAAAENDPAVVAAILDEGSPKAKAMAFFLRKGKKTLAEAVALAKAEDLL